MKKLIICLSISSLFLFSGCTELQQIASVAGSSSTSISNSANATGLKEALRVGVGTAVTSLSASNGFFGDAALKILLPPEAQSIVNNVKLIPGGTQLVNDVVLRLNRAAEDAVKEAQPIFVSAITSMTISDATNILFGQKDAATNYLKKTTSSQLVAAFAPKINASLDKKLVGNISTNDSWKSLTSAYNTVANSVVGKAANLTSVNNDLGSYVTQKALDGMFTKIAAEEAQIRTNPAARVNDILKNVFGQLDSKK